MKIVVLDGATLNPGDNPWDEVAALGRFAVYDRTPAERILERAAGAEILLTNKTPLTAETLERLPGLKFISVLATGYNVVDVDAARGLGVVVSNVASYCTNGVAQHVFALILELSNRVGLHSDAVRGGEWVKAEDFTFWKTQMVELEEKTLGIVGFGRIGRRVGELAHAFGMRVLAGSRSPKDTPDYAPFEWATIEYIFTRSDFVTLHCPLTPKTERLINKQTLALMKPEAFLVNTARGALVDERALAEALAEGTIRGAALDVVSKEPMKADNPLLGAPRCIITPHIAWATLEARRRLMKATAENVRAFLSGHPVNVVN